MATTVYDAAIKQCIYCKEDMKRDAEVCPHCRKKQTRSHWLRNTILIILTPIVLFLIYSLFIPHKSRSAEERIDAACRNQATETQSDCKLRLTIERAEAVRQEGLSQTEREARPGQVD